MIGTPLRVVVGILAFALCAPALAVANPAVQGVVVDQTGAPIAGASVELLGDGYRVEGRSSSAGEFHLDVPRPADLRIIVTAPGFARTEERVPASDLGRERRIMLPVAALTAQISVTPTRTETPVGDSPASIAVLTPDVLQTTASPGLDDALRLVPGFTLFRRSNSLTANPTTQGASLRGLGASGASRVLVLDDGIPLNDPFGGWVYWDRVPSALLQRVEVMQGGGSDLYGSGARGGIVNLVRKPLGERVLEGELSAGSLGTRQLSLAAGGELGRWSGVVAGDGLTTSGYAPVDPGQRGPVDTAANSRHATVDASLRHSTAASGHLVVRMSAFAETRGNGTPLQRNDTRLGQVAGGGDWLVLGGALEARAYASDQRFNQTFSAVAGDRLTERLTDSQHVPARAGGGSAQWSRQLGAQTVVGGIDVQRVDGSTVEATPTARTTAFTDRGGRQTNIAGYLSDTIAATSALSVTAALRFDRWRNDLGHSVTWTAADPRQQALDVSPRVQSALSPRVAAIYRVNDDVAITGSAYRAFRAPTLNELYRSFRVGNVVTQANAALVAEQVSGYETGVRLTPAGSRVFLGARGFWMDMTDPVANLTVGTQPGVILRERENLGSVRSRGVEVQAEVRLRPTLVAGASYLFDEATVSSFAADRSLVGRRVPEQPRHGATVRLQAIERFATISVQARWSGLAYDDDLNQYALAPYGTIDAFASRRVTRLADVFVSAQNLTDARYEIAMTPVTMLGWPRSVRVGIRVRAGR